MHRPVLFVSLVLSAFSLVAGAAAQYPGHPIRMIVPQAAGSSTDTLTRVLAAALSDELHQQVVVDDRPGGALTLGLDLAAKSPPDGYTLCMGPIGALAITSHLVSATFNRSRSFREANCYWPYRPRHRFIPCKSWSTMPSRTPASSSMRRRAMDRPAMSAVNCSSS